MSLSPYLLEPQHPSSTLFVDIGLEEKGGVLELIIEDSLSL